MKKEIRYNLIDIDDNQFAIIPDNFQEGKQLVSNAMINLASMNDGSELKCESRLELKQGNDLILVSVIVCRFSIEKDSWEAVDENKKKLPSGFICHIASLAVGTQRGIILVRTKDTPLHKIILPPLDLSKVVNKDYVIDMKPSQ